MSYYTAAGEPPGQWAGKGAAALGLSGQVDPAVIGRLYQQNIGPGGELLVKRRQSKAADEREEAAVSAYQTAHPYASAVELAKVRAAERGQRPASGAVLRPDRQRGQERVGAARLLPGLRPAGPRPRRRGPGRRARRPRRRARGRADGIGARSRELARPARDLHPDRAPFRPDGGVAGRRRPGRQPVPAPPVPGRRPAAARARRDLEPGPARRRRRRQVADPGLPHPAQPAARRRPGRRPDPGDQAVRAAAMSWCPGPTATAPRSAGSART